LIVAVPLLRIIGVGRAQCRVRRHGAGGDKNRRTVGVVAVAVRLAGNEVVVVGVAVLDVEIHTGHGAVGAHHHGVTAAAHAAAAGGIDNRAGRQRAVIIKSLQERVVNT